MKFSVGVKNCKICKNLEECNNEVKGFYLNHKKEEDRLTFYYKACKYKEKENKEKNDNVYLFDILLQTNVFLFL